MDYPYRYTARISRAHLQTKRIVYYSDADGGMHGYEHGEAIPPRWNIDVNLNGVVSTTHSVAEDVMRQMLLDAGYPDNQKLDGLPCVIESDTPQDKLYGHTRFIGILVRPHATTVDAG